MWTPGTKGLAKTYFDFYLRNIWTLLVEEGKKYEKNFMKSVSSEIFGNKIASVNTLATLKYNLPDFGFALREISYEEILS